MFPKFDLSSGRSARRVQIQQVREDVAYPRLDQLAQEEPLELRIAYHEKNQQREQSLSVTMRTPGNDAELAIGFLYGEGIIHEPGDVLDVCTNNQKPGCNTLRVLLHPRAEFDKGRLERHFYTTSSCGVCGKASLEALGFEGCKPFKDRQPRIPASVIRRLPGRLRASQQLFRRTGGIHAAALFDRLGKLICAYEDVGRHNAVDKIVGAQFLARRLPLAENLLMVSGRTSFEILQKALMAGLPLVAAVSAPSSLAVDIAQRFGMTLLGFVRGSRFNIYSAPDRILLRHP